MAKDKRDSDGRDAKILEQGDIFFLYRPRVDEDDPESHEDIRRFFIVLRPERNHPLRLLALGRERLPNITRHERVWGFSGALPT
jgi:hypothetical protein